jgi:F0F1-type ATP synthase membrane subunit b/b'
MTSIILTTIEEALLERCKKLKEELDEAYRTRSEAQQLATENLLKRREIEEELKKLTKEKEPSP